MADAKFIQVLLPLKLDWEPYYALPEGASAQVGDAVEVTLAGHRYTGIVTAVDVTPEGIDPKSILTIETSGTSPKVTITSPVEGNDPSSTTTTSFSGTTTPSFSGLSRESLSFWRTLSEYYLCTTGEVYKAVIKTEMAKPKRPRKKKEEDPPTDQPLTPEEADAIARIKAAFAAGKTVLLQGPGREKIYRQLEQETAQKRKSFLHLTPAKKRLLLEPVKNLGLVVVDDEHDASYKQDSPAPRFGAREAAIMLANLHGANVILGSETPSLESLYNAETGLFTKVELKQSSRQEITLINTSSEARKKGMSGSFSFKLLEAIGNTIQAGKKVLIVCRSKQAIPEATEELKNLFPDAPEKAVKITFPAGLKTTAPEGFGLIAFLQADTLLGKEDFRSDERALQTLQHLAAKAPLVIQTREPGHPVFKALQEGGNGLTFLEERRLCALPPFTRLVNLVIRDHSEKRIEYLSKLLASEIPGTSPRMTIGTSPRMTIGTSPRMTVGPYTPSYQQEGEYIRIIRVTLARDKSLKARKQAIYQTVKNFEKQYKYTGHIVIDVDPV